MRPAVRDLHFTVSNGYIYMAIKGPQELGNIDWMIDTLLEFQAKVPGFVWEKAYSENF